MTSSTTSSVPAMVFARVGAQGPVTILRKKDRGIWQAITWAMLGARVRAIGMALADSGIGRGQVAGILAETGPDWIAADIAIQGAGGIALGLTPTDPGDVTAETLRASGCRLVFVENEEQLDKVLEIRGECPALQRIVIMDMKGLREFSDPMCESLEAFSARGAAADAARPGVWDAAVAAVQAGDIAILAATSGTSEAARLVALSHANVLAQVNGAAAATGQGASDERLAFLPLSLVAERVFGLYLALSCGTISNLVESAETVPENLQEVRPTVMFAIPRIWEKLHAAITVGTSGATRLQRGLYRWAIGRAAARVAAGGAPGALDALLDRLVLKPVRTTLGLDRLRLAFVGAAPVSAELMRWYRALGVELRQAYGVAECAGVAALSPAGALRAEAVGAPVSYGELLVGDDGEVLLRGPHVAAGLWQNGVLLPVTDAEGWFHTGDLGRLDAGQLVLTGRRGDAIVAADGKETLPSAFENAVKLSPFIADAVLVGHGQARLGCLVMLEHDVVEKWAQDRNIPFTSALSLARAAEVVELIAGELRARSSGVVVAEFRIVGQRIEPGDPEVTPAMRLRRHFVLKKYDDLIDDMYRAA